MTWGVVRVFVGFTQRHRLVSSPMPGWCCAAGSKTWSAATRGSTWASYRCAAPFPPLLGDLSLTDEQWSFFFQAEASTQAGTLNKDITNWFSRNLGMMFPLVQQTYGQAVLMTPPAGMGPAAPMTGAGGAMAADDDDAAAAVVAGPLDPSCGQELWFFGAEVSQLLTRVSFCPGGCKRRKARNCCRTLGLSHKTCPSCSQPTPARCNIIVLFVVSVCNPAKAKFRSLFLQFQQYVGHCFESRALAAAMRRFQSSGIALPFPL